MQARFSSRKRRRRRQDSVLPAALGLHQSRSRLARIPSIRRLVSAPSVRRFCVSRCRGEELWRALGLRLGGRRRRLELEPRTIAPHVVHDHRKLPRDRHADALVSGPLGDLKVPGLETAEAFRARQHEVRRFIKRMPNLAATGLGDVARNVDGRARLPALGRQREIGADGLRAAAAPRIGDRSLEGQSADRPHARYADEAPAELVLAHHSDDELVRPQILLSQRRARPQNAIGDAGDQRIMRCELANARLELRAGDTTELQSKRLDRMPDGVFDVQKLGLQITPVHRQKPQPTALLALYMHLFEPARAHDMGDSLGFGATNGAASG